MQRNVLNSPRLIELKKRRQRAILTKILISLFALIVVFSLFAYLSRLNSLNIAEIKVVGNKVIDTETIRSSVEEQISGKYLWLFPKTNVLFYPKDQVTRELQNKFKRLKEVSLSIKNNKVLEISVNERAAKYTWCGVVMPDMDTDKQKCFFVDEDGYIFDEAPYFSGEVYFKLYGNTDSVEQAENPSGSYFYKQNFKQLILFKDTLIGLGLRPVSLYSKDDGDIEVFLSRRTLATGPKIILRRDADFKKVAENLQAALTTEPLQSKFKTKYSSLLYLDLRFGNKVYFKFQ